MEKEKTTPRKITFKIESPIECPHRDLQYIERNGPEHDREICKCSITGQSCNEFYEFPKGCQAVKDGYIGLNAGSQLAK